MHVSLLGVTMPIGEPIEPIVTIANAEDGTARTWTIALGFDRVLLVENDCCRLVGEPRVFPTAIAALDALDESQRTALGLDATRFAALRVLDTLRTALANDPPASRDLVVRALRELESAFGVTAVGEWKVRRPVFTAPHQLVRFCDRVVVDFARLPAEALARLHQLAVAIGAATRDGTARRTAFESVTAAHTIELPIEVEHPVHRETRVTQLALVSEDERPELVFQPVDRYAGPTLVADPLTAAYDLLVHVSQRIRFLQRMDGPPQILENEARWLQAVVDEIADVAQSPPEVTDAWEITQTRHEHVRLTYLGSNPATDGQDPSPAVLWLDADTIATMRGDQLVTISLATKAVLREYPINYAHAQSCDDSGRYVLFNAEPEQYGGFGIGCLDLHTGEWLETLPDHIPAVTVGYDENSVTTLYDHRREARARGICARSFARGNRSALLSQRNDVIDGGGISATSSLLSEVSPAVLDAVSKRPTQMLLADGSRIDATPDERARLEREMQERRVMRGNQPWPTAIARVDDRWRFLVPSLHVGDVERTFFQLGFAIDCACFSPDGNRLLVRSDELLVIDVPAGAMTWRG